MNENYKILEECHNDRIKEQERLKNDINYQAKLEYSLFCVWCNAYKNKQYTEQNFRQYLKTEKELSFWIKKKIAETYFGYKYNYNYKTMNLTCKKIKAV